MEIDSGVVQSTDLGDIMILHETLAEAEVTAAELVGANLKRDSRRS